MSDDKKVEVPAKFKDLVEQIEKLSVLDLAELVKVLEEKFGVTAAAPMAMAMAPAAGAAAVEAEEKTSFTVELTATGEQKINVIKALREVTALSLKEAKDMADAAPQVVKEGVSKEEADKVKAALEGAGATVTLK